MKTDRRIPWCLTVCTILMLLVAVSASAQANKPDTRPAIESVKPNILIIWGDDIGQSNISAYTMGLVGYRTPNIDSIAKEGMIFTDYYGEQSCTAGRASFIMGQSVFRTGMSKVGLPGFRLGMRTEEPTIAGILKDQDYVTGQFGKNHLGDRNEHLPTNNGFDEFYGNLYHLNAEEEPEDEDYPQDPDFLAKFGPRGVIESYANNGETILGGSPAGRTEAELKALSRECHWAENEEEFRGTGLCAGQLIIDTDELNTERMAIVDDQTSDRAIDFMTRAVDAEKPFFVWWNGTRMHFRTHVKKELDGISGQDEYADGMVEHDRHVGKLLDFLGNTTDKRTDKLLSEDTIVFYSTDNGPHMNSWPDAAMTPFQSEKNTSWEGGWRVPAMVRWPSRIAAGVVSNDIMQHMDWFPTLLAAAGVPDIKQQLLKPENGGRSYHSKHFKDGKRFRKYEVHLDGYNFLDYLLNHGQPTKRAYQKPRDEIFYFTDDGDLAALRFQDWKLLFLEQKAKATFRAWMEPFTVLRLPLIFNLRRDPYERAVETSNTYYDWQLDHAYLIVPAQQYVLKFLTTFVAYPPRQSTPSFSVDSYQAKLEKLLNAEELMKLKKLITTPEPQSKLATLQRVLDVLTQTQNP